jgi:D-cysteine desulfhydrase
LQQAFHQAKEDGRNPYLVPYGGSNHVGAYAYFVAVEEVIDQLSGDPLDWIVFATSSGGTQAGLVAGADFHQLKTNILGISVDESESVLTKRVAELATEVSHLYGSKSDISSDQILVNDNYLGDGYGVLNDTDREAIHLFAKLEGILLDPVYTGRAGGGLIDLIRTGYFKNNEKVLFWHTGGIPALFANKYQREL